MTTTAEGKATTTKGPKERWPFRQIFPLLLVQFAQAAQVMMLFPMLVFMVRFYGIAGDDHKAVGYYTGVLASMFPLTMFLTSFFWGWLSDRIGRKPVTLIGVFSVGIGSILLGFTTNYYMALAIRIASGLFNNITSMLKCMIAEMSGEHQAKGMAYFSVAWTTGTLLGPSLAGLLAMPCNQYGDKFPSCASEDSLLRRYPFLLSFVFFGSFTLFAGAYAGLLVPETLPDKHRKPLKLNRTLQRMLTFRGGIKIITKKDELDQVEYKKLHEEEESNDEDDKDEENPLKHKQRARKGSLELTEMNGNGNSKSKDHHLNGKDWPSDQEEEARLIPSSATNSSGRSAKGKGKEGKAKDKGWFHNREIQLAVFLYALVALFYVAFEELFPLFGSARAAHGGLSLASKDIGIFMSIGGGCTIPYNLLLFPRLIKLKGTLWLTKVGAITCMVLTLVTPFLGLLAKKPEGEEPAQDLQEEQLNSSGLGDLGPTLWVALTLHAIGVHVTGTNCFASVIMVINKASPEEHFGSINSYGQMLASLARVIGPSVVGFLWTVCGRSFEHDVLLQVTIPFVFCGLTSFAIFLLAMMAPKHLATFS